MKSVYCCRPISGRSADEVFEYYTRVKSRLSKHYAVSIPMAGKSSIRTEQKFIPEGTKTSPLLTDHAIFERDKWMVTKSDIVYANLSGANERVSIGSMFELAWASLLGKYVVLVLDQNSVHRHAFVLEAADVIFASTEEAENYLEVFAKDML